MKQISPIPLVKLIFGLVVFLLGGYILLAQKGVFFGLLFIAAGMRLSMRQGIELNLEDKKYRMLYSIYAIDFGVWKPIPEIEYVSVFKTKQKTRARLIAAQALTESIVFKLNLFYQGNKHIEAYVTDSKEDAFKVSESLALALNTEVYDATQE